MTPRNETFASLAAAFAVVSLGLVSAWAQYTPTIQTHYYNSNTAGYLGKPNWTANPFAWHPVLMVAGFFLSQVLSLTSIVYFGKKFTATISYIFWQIAALCTLIGALRAVVKWKFDTQADSLITLHSWIGCITITFFAISFLFGKVVSISSLLKMNLSPTTTWIHMLLSVLVLSLTMITIVSGIMVQNGIDGCNFIRVNTDHTIINPAFYYGAHFPWSCKISNGLGLTVLFGGFFTVVGLMAAQSVALSDVKEEVESADDKGVELEAGVVVSVDNSQ